MTDAREIIAKVIEPQAWRALGLGDTLVYQNRRTSSDRKAIRIMQELAHAGVRLAGPNDRILGPDEVADVRRVVEIANRNEWSAEGDRLARALGRNALNFAALSSLMRAPIMATCHHIKEGLGHDRAAEPLQVDGGSSERHEAGSGLAHLSP